MRPIYINYLESKINSAKNIAYSLDFIERRIHKSRIISNFWRVKYVGQNGMDEQILEFLKWENGFFIELGASDGIRFSNTLHSELYHGWRGLLIEPSSIDFAKLKRNRSKLNSFVNCA